MGGSQCFPLSEGLLYCPSLCAGGRLDADKSARHLEWTCFVQEGSGEFLYLHPHCIIHLVVACIPLIEKGFNSRAFSGYLSTALTESACHCRQQSVRTTRQCQTPPSKPYAGSCLSPAPRSTGTKSSATRLAKRCRMLKVEIRSCMKCLCAKQKTKQMWSYAK